MCEYSSNGPTTAEVFVKNKISKIIIFLLTFTAPAPAAKTGPIAPHQIQNSPTILRLPIFVQNIWKKPHNISLHHGNHRATVSLINFFRPRKSLLNGLDDGILNWIQVWVTNLVCSRHSKWRWTEIFPEKRMPAVVSRADRMKRPAHRCVSKASSVALKRTDKKPIYWVSYDVSGSIFNSC